MKSAREALDERTIALYLEVPRSEVVLLQAYFELYEGIGVVRTLDLRQNLLCILTDCTQIEKCIEALEAIHDNVRWKWADIPDPAKRERYLGYFKNASDISEI